ncbi:MAG: hypothetical protein J6T73_03230, partial [Clostridia bacterium]|nr:hypothetical protein [Clostridia bacterium]
MADSKTKFLISEEKKQVLIVEDDIINQEMLKECLGDTYALIIAETGDQAMEIVREHFETISIVLLDL